jgi:hypothetical protein
MPCNLEYRRLMPRGLGNRDHFWLEPVGLDDLERECQTGNSVWSVGPIGVCTPGDPDALFAGARSSYRTQGEFGDAIAGLESVPRGEQPAGLPERDLTASAGFADSAQVHFIVAASLPRKSYVRLDSAAHIAEIESFGPPGDSSGGFFSRAPVARARWQPEGDHDEEQDRNAP